MAHTTSLQNAALRLFGICGFLSLFAGFLRKFAGFLRVKLVGFFDLLMFFSIFEQQNALCEKPCLHCQLLVDSCQRSGIIIDQISNSTIHVPQAGVPMAHGKADHAMASWEAYHMGLGGMLWYDLNLVSSIKLET